RSTARISYRHTARALQSHSVSASPRLFMLGMDDRLGGTGGPRPAMRLDISADRYVGMGRLGRVGWMGITCPEGTSSVDYPSPGCVTAGEVSGGPGEPMQNPRLSPAAIAEISRRGHSYQERQSTWGQWFTWLDPGRCYTYRDPAGQSGQRCNSSPPD